MKTVLKIVEKYRPSPLVLDFDIDIKSKSPLENDYDGNEEIEEIIA